MYDPNQSQSLSTAPHDGITPDDSPAMDEMLQGVTPLTEVAPQPQGLQLKTTGGDTLIEQIELFLRARWIFRYNVVSNKAELDRKSTRLNSSHNNQSRMPSSA